ncbi:MAG TPA: ABC transporter permease [Vicinamibacterales bacterium]|jgi:putative ABC transport system permease protein|nr:ABC transporter permease [Vicinamibacterales bacterium]
MMRFYYLLLRLYPASFRREYGDEMSAMFARRIRDAANPAARAMLWIATIGEVLANAALVHWDIFRQDVRYVARTLARTPGFAATAVLVVAIGIGATTAAFSVTDFVLLRPLPFADPGTLVKIWEKPTGYSRMEMSPANYRDWKNAAASFDAWSAYAMTSVNLIGAGEPQRVDAAGISADLLSTLGVQPLMGRRFTAQDDREGAGGTVILSYRLWQTAFGANPAVVGRRVVLGSDASEVIGVMPRTFRFPTADVALWTPLRLGAGAFQDRNNNFLESIARLRRGVSLEAARAELTVLAAQSRQQYPKENAGIDASIYRLGDEVSLQSRLLLVGLSASAACVLLIACTNLANLLLARALGRRRELAVRTALGAGRERLVRQLMTESVALAMAGGAVGVAFATVTVPLLARLTPPALPIAETPAVDLRVLAFAAIVSVATGLAFGVAPLVGAGRDRHLDGLREGVRAGGGPRERLRSALVIAEITASVGLLVCAGLLMRSLWTIQRIDPGFRTDGVLTMRTALAWPQYAPTAARDAFYARVLGDVRALPGVASAAYVSFVPLAFRGGMWPVSIDGRPVAAVANEVAVLRYVTPGFFATLGIPITRGRDISESDVRDRPFVAVVSESFVRRYIPVGDPIGRRFTYAFADREIVGVARDIRARGLERTSEPQVYLSAKQVPDGWIPLFAPKDLVIQTASASVEPTSLVPAIRAIVHKANPQQPVSDVRTLADVVDRETASRSVQVRVLGAFAAIAFVLAAVGIHGLLSFSVSQRAQEIGVRMALGAQRSDILRMVVQRSLWLAAAGVIPGLALAYAAGRGMQALLVGVTPADLPTFASAAALAVAMTMAGTLMPTLRALRVDPITALRAE